MTEVLAEVNMWVASHQPILAVVGIPLLVALSTCVVALQTTKMGLKASRLDRDLQAKIWSLEHKKERLSELKKLLSEFSAITFAADFDMEQGLSSGNPDHVLKSKAHEMVFSLIQLISDANLMVGFEDQEYAKLTDAMWFEIKILGARTDEQKEKLKAKGVDPSERFAAVSARVIKRLENSLILEGQRLSVA